MHAWPRASLPRSVQAGFGDRPIPKDPVPPPHGRVSGEGTKSTPGTGRRIAHFLMIDGALWQECSATPRRSAHLSPLTPEQEHPFVQQKHALPFAVTIAIVQRDAPDRERIATNGSETLPSWRHREMADAPDSKSGLSSPGSWIRFHAARRDTSSTTISVKPSRLFEILVGAAKLQCRGTKTVADHRKTIPRIFGKSWKTAALGISHLTGYRERRCVDLDRLVCNQEVGGSIALVSI